MKGELANINSDLYLHLGWSPDPLLELSQHTLAPKPSCLGDHGRYGSIIHAHSGDINSIKRGSIKQGCPEWGREACPEGCYQFRQEE